MAGAAHDPAPSEAGSVGAARALLAAGAVLCAVAFLVQAVAYWHYVNDDAYITFRYSRNLAAGLGPIYNVGERVEGYTNFLLMIALAAVIGAGGPGAAPIAAKLGGVASGIGAAVLAALITRRLLARARDPLPAEFVAWAAVVAAGIVAASPAFVLNTESGLETALFSFFLMLGAHRGLLEAERGRGWGSAAAFAGAVLTRPEGVALHAVFWLAAAAPAAREALAGGRAEAGAAGTDAPTRAARLWSSPRVRLSIRNGAIVTLVFAGHLAFRHLYYDGEWLPNTFHAKRGGFWAVKAAPYIADGLLVPVLGVAGLFLATGGHAIGRSRGSRQVAPVLLLAAFGTCLPFVTGPDWMLGGRLVIPYLPAVAVAVAAGWAFAAHRFLAKRPVLAMLLLLPWLATLWAYQGPMRGEFLAHTRLRARGYQTGHRAAARWIGGQAHPGDTVALMDIGIIGFELPEQTVLDLTGLTDRVIGKAKGLFLNKSYDPTYVFDRRPAFVVLALAAPGESYTRPAKGTLVRFWNEAEARLSYDPRFSAAYVRKRAPTLGGGWLDALAASLGAERVFEHAHPGTHYLLAVYRRQQP